MALPIYSPISKYAVSRYVISSVLPDHTSVWFSSLNGNIVRYHARYLHPLTECLANNHPPPSIDQRLLDSLLANGFLIDCNTDEAAIRDKLIEDGDRRARVLMLTLLPTERCNFRCRYCYERFSRGPMPRETQDAVVHYIMRHIANYGGVSIGWFGGEPLLARDVIERISRKVMLICKQRGVMYTAGMSTNAYLLDRATFDKLYHLNVFAYQITIDGMPETHNFLRPLASGKPSFDRVFRNVLYMQKARFASNVKVVIRINLTKTIHKQMEDFLHLLSKHFSGDPRFSLSIKVASDWGGSSVKEITDDLCHMEDALEWMRAAAEFGLNLAIRDELVPGGFVCYAAKQDHLLVSADGVIKKCTRALEESINNLGRLMPDGSVEIDHDKYAQWTSRESARHAQCLVCKKQPLCFNATCPRAGILSPGRPHCPFELQHMDSILPIVGETLPIFQ